MHCIVGKYIYIFVPLVPVVYYYGWMDGWMDGVLLCMYGWCTTGVKVRVMHECGQSWVGGLCMCEVCH